MCLLANFRKYGDTDGITTQVSLYVSWGYIIVTICYSESTVSLLHVTVRVDYHYYVLQ